VEPTRSPDRAGVARVVLLILCTANRCRSPMAEAFLADRLASARIGASVTSAGMLGPGVAAPSEAVAALATYGLDISGHRSRHLEAADVESADLIVAMARSHVRDAVVMVPTAWQRTFTLKELVRRADEAGPRPAGERLATWLARVGEGRVQTSLLGDDEIDDVVDPLGGTLEDFLTTAALLRTLTDRLIALTWPAS
jgi:protein-tyrosine phosphatase